MPLLKKFDPTSDEPRHIVGPLKADDIDPATMRAMRLSPRFKMLHRMVTRLKQDVNRCCGCTCDDTETVPDVGQLRNNGAVNWNVFPWGPIQWHVPEFLPPGWVHDGTKVVPGDDRTVRLHAHLSYSVSSTDVMIGAEFRINGVPLPMQAVGHPRGVTVSTVATVAAGDEIQVFAGMAGGPGTAISVPGASQMIVEPISTTCPCAASATTST